jgi:hypothetical protein
LDIDIFLFQKNGILLDHHLFVILGKIAYVPDKNPLFYLIEIRQQQIKFIKNFHVMIIRYKPSWVKGKNIKNLFTAERAEGAERKNTPLPLYPSTPRSEPRHQF